MNTHTSRTLLRKYLKLQARGALSVVYPTRFLQVTSYLSLPQITGPSSSNKTTQASFLRDFRISELPWEMGWAGESSAGFLAKLVFEFASSLASPKILPTSCNLERPLSEARNMTKIQISQCNPEHRFILGRQGWRSILWARCFPAPNNLPAAPSWERFSACVQDELRQSILMPHAKSF